MRKSNRKTLMAALREARWDLETACNSLGITPAQLAQHMSDQELDDSWLAIQAQIDLQVMQRANHLLDMAMDEVKDVLQNADDSKLALNAAKIAMDFHFQMAERVQLPAMLRRVEQAMDRFGFDSEG